jgi:hypothetical protein
MVAAQVTHALDPDAPPALKERVELALVTTVAAAFGYATTKLSLASSIGRPESAELDRGVRRTLTLMLQGYLRSPL